MATKYFSQLSLAEHFQDCRSYPDMAVEKKTDSPVEDKSISDSSALKPVLEDFFSDHPDFKPKLKYSLNPRMLLFYFIIKK